MHPTLDIAGAVGAIIGAVGAVIAALFGGLTYFGDQLRRRGERLAHIELETRRVSDRRIALDVRHFRAAPHDRLTARVTVLAPSEVLVVPSAAFQDQGVGVAHTPTEDEVWPSAQRSQTVQLQNRMHWSGNGGIVHDDWPSAEVFLMGPARLSRARVEIVLSEVASGRRLVRLKRDVTA